MKAVKTKTYEPLHWTGFSWRFRSRRLFSAYGDECESDFFADLPGNFRCTHLRIIKCHLDRPLIVVDFGILHTRERHDNSPDRARDGRAADARWPKM